MKTKNKYWVLIGLSAVMLFGLGSCSKENTDVDNGETKSVHIKIEKSRPATYRTEFPASDGDAIFNGGNLYFVNSLGIIVARYRISTDTTTGDNINLSDLTTGGVTLSNIPASALAVHVTNADLDQIGNVTNNISVIQKHILMLKSQVSPSNINLYGSSSLVYKYDDVYSCEVPLKLTVSRIQLTGIQSGSSTITGFKLDGIFIDNYYSAATVDGVVEETYFVNHDSDANMFRNDTFGYSSVESPTVYDWYSPSLQSAGALPAISTPTEDHVWIYNVFATETGVVVPRVVIRLSDITSNDGTTYPNPQFLTIKGFKIGDEKLSTIEAGKIYSIERLIFDERNLTDTPNMKTIDVDVSIELPTWEVIPVAPEL